MPTAPYRGWPNPQYAFDKRRGVVERGTAQQVAVYDQVGVATVGIPAGKSPVIGEGTFNVNFLYSFIEKPTFTHGAEMGANFPLVKGSYPTFSATVYRWVTTPAGHSTLYIGAIVAFVAGGVANSQIICHYSFRARAMSPLSTATNDTGSA